MPLTSAAEYKVYNPGAAAVADAFIVSMIEAATNAIEDAAGRKFAEDAYVEVLNGQGLPYVALRAWPVDTIDTIELVYESGSHVVNADEYRLDADTGIVWRSTWHPDFQNTLPSRIEATGGWWREWSSDLWPEGNQNIRVTYTGGFDPVPADVKLAVWSVVDAILANRGKDMTLQSENLGSYSYTRGEMSGSAWIATANSVAARFRRGAD